MEQHQTGRSVYYRDFHGVMVVFDASSERSFASVGEWLAELADVLAEREIRRRAASARRMMSAEEEGKTPTSAAAARRRQSGGGSDWSVSARGGTGAVLLSPETPPPNAAASDKSRAQTMSEALKSMPILLVANKMDSLPHSHLHSGFASNSGSRGGGRGPQGRGASSALISRYQAAVVKGASRCKLDVPLGLPSEAGAVSMCGFTCRRPQRQRVTIDVPVAHAVAGEDDIPRDVIDAFLDDIASTVLARDQLQAGTLSDALAKAGVGSGVKGSDAATAHASGIALGSHQAPHLRAVHGSDSSSGPGASAIRDRGPLGRPWS